MHARKAAPTDLDALATLRARLWPEGSVEEHREEARAIVDGHPPSTMPLVLFVAEHEGRLIGFAEVGLRSHADGCDASRPCGFLEGWYVTPEHRRRGVGRLLVDRAEAWALEQGSTELGSDTWIDSEDSQGAHAALGFEVVDRCVHFKKKLGPAARSASSPPGLHYGADLARIHHDHFGMVARAAARELVTRLSKAGISSGTVIDLAAGSGILSRTMVDAGFAAWAVDISEEMLRIARAEAPDATFVHGSLWQVDLPPCVAVAAVGEAFSYAVDPSAKLSALEARLRTIHGALAPGGLLLFDVASPGRSGPSGTRRAFWTHEGAYLGMREEEDRPRRKLSREITQFVREGSLYRRVEETHVLQLYAPEDIEGALAKSGFKWERLGRYDQFDLAPGWNAYAATRA